MRSREAIACSAALSASSIAGMVRWIAIDAAPSTPHLTWCPMMLASESQDDRLLRRLHPGSTAKISGTCRHQVRVGKFVINGQVYSLSPTQVPRRARCMLQACADHVRAIDCIGSHDFWQLVHVGALLY